MSSPFDYVKSFNTKVSIWEDDNGSGYSPFMVNKSLSFMQDCIFVSNEMNRLHNLNERQQHDFYFNIIPKGKRYGSWIKKESNPDVQIIADYFSINNRLAEKYLSLLSDEQLLIIKNKMNTGGKNGK